MNRRAPLREALARGRGYVDKITSATFETLLSNLARLLALLPDLLGEVIGLAGLSDQLELRFDPVDVLFRGDENLLEKVAASVVREAAGALDAIVQRRHGSALEAEVETELLGYGLPHVDLAEALHIGHALEVQDPSDEPVGVAHLADGLLAQLFPEPLVAPVLAHAGMDEVLVDGRELGREDLVEQRAHVVVSLHHRSPR